MSFRDSLSKDTVVFVNDLEHAENFTIEIAGKRYKNVPVIVSERGADARVKAMFGMMNTHDEGLSKQSFTLILKEVDIGNRLPKYNSRVRFGNGDFLPSYIVKHTQHAYGIAQIGLEKVDE